MSEPLRTDLIRNIIAIGLVSAMLIACFWIIKPFLPAIIWAAMIVLATWPEMLIIQDKLGGRRRLAVGVMIGILLLLFVIPFALAVGTIVENAPQITALGKQLTHVSIPEPPGWVRDVPMVGADVDDYWQDIVDEGPGELAKRVAPYAKGVAGWLAAKAGNFGMMVIHFLLTLILAALLYLNGERAAEMVRKLARRIAAERGENAVVLAGKSIRAVALGVVLTALIQSVFAGIGLAVAGIPYASLLTALIFMLTIAQLGGGPVLIPAVIWVYWQGSIAWGTALLVWSAIALSMDGFLRPILIRKGANLPLLLIFAGVIGGLIAFGLIGLFIGPVLLAVSYTLLLAWIDEKPPDPSAPKPAAE